jgi:uncharacterized protein (DUF1697 family)
MALTHVALFRGVNVGGHGLLSMADLRTFLGAIGLHDPQTLLQSGNAVFGAGRRTSSSVEALIAREARTRLSLTSDVFVRSAAEWDAVVRANPFTSEAETDPARLVVVVLKDAPLAASLAALRQSIVGREQVRADLRHLYIVYPDGQGTSKLTGAVIERTLKTRGTARNWNTALRVSALFARDREV